MKIELTARIKNAKGDYAPGTIVDWPEKDARPLVESNVAVAVEEKPAIASEVDVLLATNVSNLDAMLAQMDDGDVIREARDQDYRVTARELYDDRLDQLEGIE